MEVVPAPARDLLEFAPDPVNRLGELPLGRHPVVAVLDATLDRLDDALGGRGQMLDLERGEFGGGKVRHMGERAKEFPQQLEKRLARRG